MRKTFQITIGILLISAVAFSQPFKLSDTDVKPGQFQNLYGIHFGVGSPHLQLTALAQLDSLVYFLKRNPAIKIELGVHTDLRGDDKQNLELSKKRAKTLRTFLIDQAIQADRFKTIGFGETKPVMEYEDWKKLSDSHRCGHYGQDNTRVTIVVRSTLQSPVTHKK